VRNLVRRLRKLEVANYDSTGLVPHSEAWFAYFRYSTTTPVKTRQRSILARPIRNAVTPTRFFRLDIGRVSGGAPHEFA